MEYSPSASLDLNHRKRRRNRMRVSCLNCYASKRKCDRKRPCTRCIKHGLTGLCIYELDDHTARDASEDETTRLRNRIAELESVIRELNNRPHPRWFAPDGVTHNPKLVALRGPRKRRNASHQMPNSKCGYSPNSSVDAFFDSIAEGDGTRVKLEHDVLTPEFTSSEAGASRALSDFDSPLTPLSCLSPCSSPKGLGIIAVSQFNTPPPSNSNASSSFSDESPRFHHCAFHGSPTFKLSPALFERDPSPIASLDPKSILLSPAASESSEEGLPLALIYPMDDMTDDDIHHESFDMMPNQLGLSLYGEEPCRLSISIQTSPPPLPICHAPSFSCRCILNPSVYTAMVYFATALRTSREALETLHGDEHGEDVGRPDCEFYKMVVELDEHIFSISPQTPQPSSIELKEPQASEQIDDEEEVDEESDAMLEDVFSQSTPAPLQPTPTLPMSDLPQIESPPSPTLFFDPVYAFPEPILVPAEFSPTLTPAHFTPALTYPRPMHSPTSAPVHFTSHFTPMLAPSSPPVRAPDSAIRHEYAHRLPFYSAAETYPPSPFMGIIDLPPQEDVYSNYSRGWV